jgi:hypothetical protein
MIPSTGGAIFFEEKADLLMAAWTTNLLNGECRLVYRASDGRPGSLAMQSSIKVESSEQNCPAREWFAVFT